MFSVTIRPDCQRQLHFVISCVNFRQRTDAAGSVAEQPAFGSVHSDPQPSPPDDLEPEPQQNHRDPQ